jgi:type IV secretory pathway TrbD component
MPGAAEAEQLNAFEDAVIERAGNRAVLVGVITTSGMREFVLYTGSGEWIAAFHQDLIAALPTHTVQVMAKTDPKWSTYRQFASS